ncbi:MAG TPA: PfkB family carbohydrate kinase [Nitrososphaerales archaeon]|nr:PfkB family carbohydrate kinase [Nitrososphaerales archaeon]
MPLEGLDKEQLTAVVRKFQGRKVLVAGDLIVSRFVEVAARKLAREAPVPAGDFVGEHLLPGGAANLARELVSLGASASVVGLVGSDEHAAWLRTEFDRNGISHAGVITDQSRPTSLRTWVMVNGFHNLRIDRDDRRDASFAISKKLLEIAVPTIKDVDCIIMSDYDRGAITSVLINGLVAAARENGKIVVAQPKMHHYLDFSGVTYVKSNLEEAANATGMKMVNDTSLRNMGINLLSRLECKGILVTRGEAGMTLFDEERVTHFPPLAGRKDLFSKVGVRDAMTGVFALALAAGGNAYQATSLSNITGAARSSLQRTASLSVPNLEAQMTNFEGFAQRIVQAPVRR